MPVSIRSDEIRGCLQMRRVPLNRLVSDRLSDPISSNKEIIGFGAFDRVTDESAAAAYFNDCIFT
jgi:hypothetical protein